MKKPKRIYYGNGALYMEGDFKNGEPVGFQRRWYPNGILEEEFTVYDGVPVGVAKKWNSQGELLGTYEIVEGTGIQKEWYENGRLRSEVSWVGGQWTGRQRLYGDDGEMWGETYWIKDKRVSAAEYLQACSENSELPRYDVEQVKPCEDVRESGQCSVHVAGCVIESLMEGPRVREALAWLLEEGVPFRSLGEHTDRNQSVQLVEKLYSFGAVVVLAAEIEGDVGEEQNSGRLVVELPADARRRREVLLFCSQIGEELGFDPIEDTGQSHELLMLD